jgi:hypothetical protein
MKKLIIALVMTGFVLAGMAQESRTINIVENYNVALGDTVFKIYLSDPVYSWVLGVKWTGFDDVDAVLKIEECADELCLSGEFLAYPGLDSVIVDQAAGRQEFKDNYFGGKWLQVRLTCNSVSAGTIQKIYVYYKKPRS